MKLYGEKSSKFGHFLAILLEVRKHPKNRVLGGGGFGFCGDSKTSIKRLPI